MDFNKLNFSNVDKKYLPFTFWSLNDKLSKKETERQVEIMNAAGIGGFFLHARGGLETEYMSEEWFSNIKAATKAAHAAGMLPYAYDENGWPSGFADGAVPALGDKYRLKSLCCSAEPAKPEVTVAQVGDYYFYTDINPYYSNLIDAEVTDKFIELAYEPYLNNSASVDGYFTDEPQLSRLCGIPWSDRLPDEFKNAYGFDLIPHLPKLFYNSDGAADIRVKYWRLVASLFCHNFAEKIYDFCQKHGKFFTGHYLLEEWLMSQITSNGAVMPSYRYFDIPGMDMLTLIKTPDVGIIAPYQVASVAHQYGKKQVLSESFAACGHAAAFDDLMAVFSWQAVRGVTIICLHLSPYSMRGLRKRDYPPAIGPQQPWWKDFHLFSNAMGRIGAFLSEGRTDFDTLVLHPITSCWAAYSATGAGDINAIQGEFTKLLFELEKKHLLFDLGDEIIMAEDAKIEGSEIVIGQSRYKRLIVPFDEHLLPETQRLIDEFKAAGGIVLKNADSLAASDIISSPDITYTRRLFDNFTFHYFVNSTDLEKKAFVSKGAKKMDIITGELSDFDGNLTLAPFGSAVIIDDGTERIKAAPAVTKKALDLSGKWQLVSSGLNSLILDRCSYSLDGEEGEETYILNVFTRAINKKAEKVICRFEFNVADVPAEIYLGLECPENFSVSLNGSDVSTDSDKEFFDRSVKLLNLAPFVKPGKNSLTLTTNLRQSDSVYEQLRRSEIFEAEKNKIKYDYELEAVYLVGDFGVSCSDTSDVNETLVRADGFTIEKMPTEITLSDIEKQGFPFFAGSMRLKKSFTLQDTDVIFEANKKGLAVIGVTFNGKKEDNLIFAPYRVDLSERAVCGENTLELELTNSLRNLLGPHHLSTPRETCVAPGVFHEEANPFLSQKAERIKEYNLLKMGLI